MTQISVLLQYIIPVRVCRCPSFSVGRGVQPAGAGNWKLETETLVVAVCESVMRHTNTISLVLGMTICLSQNRREQGDIAVP